MTHSRNLVIPFSDQPITLSTWLAVLQHCLRFAFAYSIGLEMEKNTAPLLWHEYCLWLTVNYREQRVVLESQQGDQTMQVSGAA